MTHNIYCAKIPHKTEAKARRALRNSIRRMGKRRTRDLVPLHGARTYRCRVCDAWHWGHMSSAVKQRNKNAKHERRERAKTK